MRVLCAIALLVVGATAQSTRQRPVTKVIKLIEKMLTELHADAEKDQEIFDNMECWYQPFFRILCLFLFPFADPRVSQ